MNNTSILQRGGVKMPTIQVLRSGQVTLPSKLRSMLNLHPGDLLEADIKEQRIILTPVTLTPKNKAEAEKRFFKLVEENWEKNKDLNPDEVQRIVDQAVKEVRRGNFK